MAINNKADYLAFMVAEGGFTTITDIIVAGQNRQLAPGTYTQNLETGEVDSVTFLGTAKHDTLIGGGGEFFAFFLGTAGNDLYGGGAALGNDDVFSLGIADYSDAPSRIVVNLDLAGSRTFTEENGAVQTVATLGRAPRDGYGGTDTFLEATAFGLVYSSVDTVIGTRFNDTLVGNSVAGSLFGGAGNDRLTGNSLYGGDGNDVLTGRATGNFELIAAGGDGDDLIFGTDFSDVRLTGGPGNDRIFAGRGNDRDVRGEAGNDRIFGGDGDDYIDGGIGADILVSGSGNDIINPDVEFFFLDANQATDGARDVIRVTRHDLGDFTDIVLSRAFEVGLDEIRFRDAVKGGLDYRMHYEEQTINDATGRLYQANDLAGMANTVLHIDVNRNGFGDEYPDLSDYFLVVIDSTIAEHGGFLLT